MDADSVVLPASRTACSLARDWIEIRLAPLHLEPALQEDIVLCVDELVANVVLHTASSPVLTVSIGDPILVEVADTCPTAASLRDRDDALPGGWGLRIVERVADRWGSVARQTGGKVVWFAVATGSRTSSG